MEWLALIISVIALILSIWAVKTIGGMKEIKKEVESLSSLGESLRKKTADLLDRVEKKVRGEEREEKREDQKEDQKQK